MTSEILFVELIQISYKNEDSEEVKMFLGEPEARELYEKLHKKFGDDNAILLQGSYNRNGSLNNHIKDIKDIIQMFVTKEKIE